MQYSEGGRTLLQHVTREIVDTAHYQLFGKIFHWSDRDRYVRITLINYGIFVHEDVILCIKANSGPTVRLKYAKFYGLGKLSYWTNYELIITSHQWFSTRIERIRHTTTQGRSICFLFTLFMIIYLDRLKVDTCSKLTVDTEACNLLQLFGCQGAY